MIAEVMRGADGGDTGTSLGTRITSTQIASGVPCFQMMKCRLAGGGGARCSMYGFRERTSDVNKKKKTAAGCLPLSVPGRN